MQIENRKNNYINAEIDRDKTLVLNRKENLIYDQMEYSDNCDIVNKFNTFFIDSIS